MDSEKPRRVWPVLIGIVLVVTVGYWLIGDKETVEEAPLLARSVESQGADHVADISEISYNSNPPTSGPHFPVWAKRGVYDRMLSDGYLIHSLEHGYVIISYDCIKLKAGGWVKTVFAHETGELHEEPFVETATESASQKPLTLLKITPSQEKSWFTPEGAPEEEVELPQEFVSDSCKSMVDELATLLDKYQRLIIVPRIGMESAIAITAWTKIDTMDTLDISRIERFAREYHNKGPEKTME